MALKVVGYLSTESGKVYSKKSTAKGVDTKLSKARFNSKLNKLQDKFNNR